MASIMARVLLPLLASLSLLDGAAAGQLQARHLTNQHRIQAEMGRHRHQRTSETTKVSGINAAAVDSSGYEMPDTERMEMPLDHYGRDKRTFDNRYWVNDTFYEVGGPIFLYDLGEGAATDDTIAFELGSDPYYDTSAVMRLAQDFNGIAIVWEHRFYGQSTAVTISSSTDPEEFRYLTTEQALLDVVYFAANFSRDAYPHVDFRPNATPWIVVGGSYPGIRAAQLRNHFPDAFLASWASSAPLIAQVNMSSYYDPIYTGLRAFGYENCTNDVRTAVQAMDKLLADDDSAEELKVQFFGKNGAKPFKDNGLFADAISAVWGTWQSYGVEPMGSQYAGIGDFCDWISYDPDSDEYSESEGWAGSLGADFTIERWASWPGLPDLVWGGDEYCSRNDTGTQQQQSGCQYANTYSDPDTVAWMWQYCTEWGYFQSANVGDKQLVPAALTLAHLQQQCHDQFAGASSDLLPDWPAADELNRRLGGGASRPSNVYFTQGEFDPWRTLSPLAGDDHVATTTRAPRCNVTAGDSLFGRVIRHGLHCSDLVAGDVETETSLELFSGALKGWIGCFKGLDKDADVYKLPEAWKNGAAVAEGDDGSSSGKNGKSDGSGGEGDEDSAAGSVAIGAAGWSMLALLGVGASMMSL